MNRQEPYVGMPIILGDFDDEPTACCGQMENYPQNASSSEIVHKEENSRQTMPAMQNMKNMQPMSLAMAYVPWQKWSNTYPLDEGLKKGTIFPDLDLPFEGKRKGGMRK